MEANAREETSPYSSEDSGEVDENYDRDEADSTDPFANVIPVERLKNGWRTLSVLMKVTWNRPFREGDK